MTEQKWQNHPVHQSLQMSISRNSKGSNESEKEKENKKTHWLFVLRLRDHI